MSDKHLYDTAGNFLFRGKKLSVCALCKGKDFVYDVGALGPSMRFCKRCILRHGPKPLRRDANVALANAKRTTDRAREKMADMAKRYAARFNTTIKWVFDPRGNQIKKAV